MNLKGKCALITGASGSLGKVIAATLAEMGANLALCDAPGKTLEPLAKQIREKWNVKTTCYYCDLESESQRNDFILKIINEPSVDIVVNNAAFVGTSSLPGWSTKFEDQSIEAWRRSLEVNLVAIFHLTQGLTPKLIESKNGVIINISSIYGVFGPDWSLYKNTQLANPAAYAASKAGLIQLTKWLSTTLAPSIRVNCISPGGIFRGQPNSFVEQYKKRTPLARMAVEDDFRGAIAFLASNMSSYVTGQNILIDGGWSVW
jgi:NAD(P)-dependent dehydrogenase (short-subunit alcohol dehydrogenase family)